MKSPTPHQAIRGIKEAARCGWHQERGHEGILTSASQEAVHTREVRKGMERLLRYVSGTNDKDR